MEPNILVLTCADALTAEHRENILREFVAQMEMSRGRALMLPAHLGATWLRPGDSIRAPDLSWRAIQDAQQWRVFVASPKKDGAPLTWWQRIFGTRSTDAKAA